MSERVIATFQAIQPGLPTHSFCGGEAVYAYELKDRPPTFTMELRGTLEGDVFTPDPGQDEHLEHWGGWLFCGYQSEVTP